MLGVSQTKLSSVQLPMKLLCVYAICMRNKVILPRYGYGSDIIILDCLYLLLDLIVDVQVFLVCKSLPPTGLNNVTQGLFLFSTILNLKKIYLRSSCFQTTNFNIFYAAYTLILNKINIID